MISQNILLFPATYHLLQQNNLKRSNPVHNPPVPQNLSVSRRTHSGSSTDVAIPFFGWRMASLRARSGVQTSPRSFFEKENLDDPVVENQQEGSGIVEREGRNWTTSILLGVFYGALMFYVFKIAPFQNPPRDIYFLKKLLYLKGDDGFRMNQVLVSLWNMMALWPMVYSKLLFPTGRSSKSKIPIWPFATLSFFLGAYALIPYFILWNPPAPPVEETEVRRWPLNFLESKLTSGLLLAAGAGVMIYAALATGSDWTEFFQFFRESKFINIMSIDFVLCSAFAPFWVYNDMSARKWFDEGSWLLPLSIVPFLGPALYLILRPPPPTKPVSSPPEKQYR